MRVGWREVVWIWEGGRIALRCYSRWTLCSSLPARMIATRAVRNNDLAHHRVMTIRDRIDFAPHSNSFWDPLDTLVSRTALIRSAYQIGLQRGRHTATRHISHTRSAHHCSIIQNTQTLHSSIITVHLSPMAFDLLHRSTAFISVLCSFTSVTSSQIVKAGHLSFGCPPSCRNAV